MMRNADDLSFLYVTFPSPSEAKAAASNAVERRLAACANVFPQHHSIYRWQEAVEATEEVAVIFKTSRERALELSEAIQGAHPYETPCIVEMRASAVSRAFGDWILGSTSKQEA